jgi:hypothetical protein
VNKGKMISLSRLIIFHNLYILILTQFWEFFEAYHRYQPSWNIFQNVIVTLTQLIYLNKYTHPTMRKKKAFKTLVYFMCVHPLMWVMGHSIHSYLPTLISYKGEVEDSRTLLIGLGTIYRHNECTNRLALVNICGTCSMFGRNKIYFQFPRSLSIQLIHS